PRPAGANPAPPGKPPPARLEQGRLADAALGPHARHETATVSELLAVRARDLLDPALDDDDVVGSLLRISLGERPLDYDRIVHPEAGQRLRRGLRQLLVLFDRHD